MTIRSMEDRTTPVVHLIGNDGNAFAVMDAVRKAMQRAEWRPEEMVEVIDDMMSSDYNHLLATAMKVCEVE